MSNDLTIRIVDDSAFASDILQEVMVSGIEIKSRTPIERGLPVPFEMVVALGSAGGFTVIYQVICKLLDKDKNRIVTVSCGGKELSIKGHSMQEERELLEKLMSECVEEKPREPEESKSLPRDTANLAILFWAADPTNAVRLRLGEECHKIQEELERAKMRERFVFHQRMSVRPEDLSRTLLDVNPQIVHFSGHGAESGALCIENDVGEIHPVSPDALSALFKQFADQVSCVILNACYTEIQAKAIAQHIKNVIGMSNAISDEAAIAFAAGFYQALGAGRTIQDAYNMGCVQIGLHGIPEHLTPILVVKDQP